MANREGAEILSPVGTWEMCLAAVHNGADAIYVGMPGFNARGRTETFSIDTLRDMTRYCHLYGVKIFLACNILIFEEEFDEIEDLLREIIPLGIDALIVQDIGLIRKIREIAPYQVIHGSTQMTVSSPEAIAQMEDLGISRFVLARELSIDEIRAIRRATEKEIEVFVHGALCVSYSGQCLTSESLGGRSANRGQCAQSCRLPYELIVDDKVFPLGDRKYLVSPKDLCSLGEIKTLLDIGVDSFKIEGRLKSPEYVAATTKAYRQGLDSREVRTQLGVTYSRDFFSGWLHGVNHQSLVRGDFSSHAGMEIGRVITVQGRTIRIDSSASLMNGQGVLFLNTKTDARLGGTIYQYTQINESTAEISLENTFAYEAVSVNDHVFLNSDPQQKNILRSSFEHRELRKRIAIKGALSGTIGSRLVYELRDNDGNSVIAESVEPLIAAEKRALDEKTAFDELSALSHSPFYLESLSWRVSDLVFCPHRTLRNLKQHAASLLAEKRMHVDVVLPPLVPRTRSVENKKAVIESRPKLHVLIRDIQQLDALPSLPIGTVYLDYEYGKQYGESVERIRAMGYKAAIATTRILKPGEQGHLKQIQRIKPDQVLVRNIGALSHLADRDVPLIGDFSLNVTNSLTADWFVHKGFKRLTPSYDLNQSQLERMITASPSVDFEITIHQYMPAFHMEHCVFAMCLSNGSSWRDCGKPCEKHRVALKTTDGALHPLKADAECRNTMFNGRPQSAARLIEGLTKLGVVNYRFEALFETAVELRNKLEHYIKLMRGEITAFELFKLESTIEQYGVTDGQLLSIRSHQDRKKTGGLKTPEFVSRMVD
jgi:putative protease